MTHQFSRFMLPVALVALLGACDGMGMAPSDQPEYETMGDQINEPTDGVGNELTVE